MDRREISIPAVAQALTDLRRSHDLFQINLAIIDEARKALGSSILFSQIGTSKAEIESLRFERNKASAKFWLEFIRHNPTSYGIGFNNLRMAVEAGGFTLAEIDINEMELEKLRVEGCKAVAKFYLRVLLDGFEGPFRRNRLINCLIAELRGCDLSPANFYVIDVDIWQMYYQAMA